MQKVSLNVRNYIIKQWSKDQVQSTIFVDHLCSTKTPEQKVANSCYITPLHH